MTKLSGHECVIVRFKQQTVQMQHKQIRNSDSVVTEQGFIKPLEHYRRSLQSQATASP